MNVNPWKVSTLAFAGALVLVVGCNMVPSARAERQPHMVAALGQLKAAKSSLQTATADKGGHRIKAIALVNSAIEETEKGIAFDNAR